MDVVGPLGETHKGNTATPADYWRFDPGQKQRERNCQQNYNFPFRILLSHTLNRIPTFYFPQLLFLFLEMT